MVAEVVVEGGVVRDAAVRLAGTRAEPLIRGRAAVGALRLGSGAGAARLDSTTLSMDYAARRLHVDLEAFAKGRLLLDADGVARVRAQATEAMAAVAAALTEPDPDGKPGTQRIRPELWPDTAFVDVGIRSDLSEVTDARTAEAEDFSYERVLRLVPPRREQEAARPHSGTASARRRRDGDARRAADHAVHHRDVALGQHGRAVLGGGRAGDEGERRREGRSGSSVQSSSPPVRRASTSRLPTWFAGPTTPSFSICSMSLAARL